MKMTTLWKEMMMLDVIYGESQAWSSMNPVTLVQSWRKLIPDREDDLQGFPNEKIKNLKFLTWCVL
jgi:hypothetical protein